MTDETDYNMYRFFTDFMVEKSIVEEAGIEGVSEYIQDMLHDMLMDGYPFSALNIELVEENV